MSRPSAAHQGLATAVVCLTIILIPQFSLAADPSASNANIIQIGMADSLLKDVPETLVGMMGGPFATLMEQQTGLRGKLSKAGPALELAEKIVDGKLQLGIFQGIEFAWVKEKYPELKAMMVIINQRHQVHAKLVVRNDSSVQGFGDLTGQSLAMQRGPVEHCRVFVERYCQEHGCNSEEMFEKICRPSSIEDALDDVVDGSLPAAVLDSVPLDCYQRRKPGRSSRLKVVQQSEFFPPACVAFREGALDPATVQRFSKGMQEAAKTPLGKQLLILWKITGFELVPPDYEQQLLDICKAYPAH